MPETPVRHGVKILTVSKLKVNSFSRKFWKPLQKSKMNFLNNYIMLFKLKLPSCSSNSKSTSEETYWKDSSRLHTTTSIWKVVKFWTTGLPTQNKCILRNSVVCHYANGPCFVYHIYSEFVFYQWSFPKYFNDVIVPFFWKNVFWNYASTLIFYTKRYDFLYLPTRKYRSVLKCILRLQM